MDASIRPCKQAAARIVIIQWATAIPAVSACHGMEQPGLDIVGSPSMPTGRPAQRDLTAVPGRSPSGQLPLAPRALPNQTADVDCGILHRGHELAAHVIRRLMGWRARLDERRQPAADILDIPASAVQSGAPALLRGADDVARTFLGRAQVALSAVVKGEAGAVRAPGGRPRVVFRFTISGDKVSARSSWTTNESREPGSRSWSRPDVKTGTGCVRRGLRPRLRR